MPAGIGYGKKFDALKAKIASSGSDSTSKKKMGKEKFQALAAAAKRRVGKKD